MQVWKVGSRWSETGAAGTSLLKDVFLKYGIVFVGNKTDVFKNINEGDIIAVADGYDILALGQAITPPASITKFDIQDNHDDKTLARYFQNENIICIRTDLIILDECDTLYYPKRAIICKVWKIRDQVISTFKKYKNTISTSNQQIEVYNDNPNLFNWANKELAQDSFLCWLAEWGSKNLSSNYAMVALGNSFINSMFEKFQITDLQFNSIKVYKQYANIDILVKLDAKNGEKYVLLIEDKINADAYNPFDIYLKRIEKDNEFAGYKILPLFIKTGEQCQFSYQHVLKKSFRIFLRKDFLDLFKNHQTTVDNNNILSDFYKHLDAINKLIESYNYLPIKDWHWDSWKGFYSFLNEKTRLDRWSYVPNKSNGFLCCYPRESFKLKDCIIYWQIESDKKALCLKIGEVGEHRSSIRNMLYETFMRYLKTKNILNVKKPSRFGAGCYMTIAIVEQHDWLGDDTDIVDKEKVANNINYFVELLEKFKDELANG